VTVVPVRIGGGTRLKVVEALAMAKAVVSTSLGCEGLAVRSGDNALLADDAGGFASAIVQLLANRRRPAGWASPGASSWLSATRGPAPAGPGGALRLDRPAIEPTKDMTGT